MHKPYTTSYYYEHVTFHCGFSKVKERSPTKRRALAEDNKNQQKLQPIELDKDFPHLMDPIANKKRKISDDIMDSDQPLAKLRSIVPLSPPIDVGQLSIVEAIAGYGQYINKRSSGESTKAQSTKDAKISKVRSITQISPETVWVDQLLDPVTIESMEEAIDGMPILDGSKYPYANGVIALLTYLRNEVPSYRKSGDLDWAISKWERISLDFQNGRKKERSKKKKETVDRYDRGEMIQLLDVFDVVLILRDRLKNVDKRRKPKPDELELMYCFIVLNLCLKSIIRPSVFLNMSVDEFLAARQIGDVFVIRVESMFILN